MIEVIKFPDTEAMLVTYLKSHGFKAATKYTGQDELVKVTRVGGTKVRLNTESAMHTFQVWAPTELAASDLASRARAYVHAMAGTEVNGSWIYRVVDVGGPVYSPDPEGGKPRYQFTVSLDVKGVKIDEV